VASCNWGEWTFPRRAVRVIGSGVLAAMLASCAPAAPPAKAPAAPAAAPQAAPAAPAATSAPAAKPAEASKPAEAAKPAAAAATPKAGGRLVIGFEGDPSALDPAANSQLGQLRISRQITETLLKEDTRVTDKPIAPIVPALAEKWEVSPDGKTYTFQLRKGVKFHDGSDFNAESVKFNLDRVMDKNFKHYFAAGASVTARTTRWIDSYSAVDLYTFRIVLKGPHNSFERVLIHPSNGIVSPKAIEEMGNDGFPNKPVGTGPFRFKERERNVKVVIEKNPEYWDKSNPVYLDEVVFRSMADSAARAAALKTGEIDMDVMVLPDFADSLRADPNVELVLVGNPHIWYFHINHTDPLFKDVRVRRALWHAIDREGLAKSLLSGTGQPAWQFLPPKNPAHRADLKNPYPYDPAKAKQLLAEAGIPAGTKLNIAHPNEGASYMRPKEMSQFVQANLKAIGLDATLASMEWGAFVAAGAKLIEPTTQLHVSAWQSISHDPYMLEQLFSCEFRTPKGSNFGQYCNEELEKQFLAARQEPDMAKAIPLYQKAEDMMIQDVSGLPISNDFSPRAVRKNIKNFIQGPSTFFDLYQVWIDK
jgi:peptide/nickel transport system substrate-binding protein